MHRLHRFLLAGLIVVSGLALVPYIGFPAEQFNWQKFAGIYDPRPVLVVNHDRGHRDSVFTLRGSSFAPNSTLRIVVNGRQMGTAMTDGQGRATFLLTTNNADQGFYVVSVNQVSSANFWIDNAAPRWGAEGTGPTFDIPDGIAFNFFRYLPLVRR